MPATTPGRPASHRALAGYLLSPRPDVWAKALIAPACYLLATASTGDCQHWRQLTAAWLILELLIYPARYQWNDIRGIDADQQHAEATARARLPAGDGPAGRRVRRLLGRPGSQPQGGA